MYLSVYNELMYVSNKIVIILQCKNDTFNNIRTYYSILIKEEFDSYKVIPI